MSRANYELHERLDRLSAASADRDVLVTLAVPPDQSIGEARRPVETDYAEATQRDDRPVPKPLEEALDDVRSRLNEYEEVPEDGLVLYAGVVDGDLVTATFDDLPVTIDEGTYDHGNEFDLEPLENVTGPDATYGLLVVERGGAALGRLRGDGVEPIETFDSDVPGKSSAGGQSAERFERDRERQKRDFFDAVAERARLEFVEGEPVDGVLLGGTTGTIEEFRDEADLDHRLAEDLLGEFAVEYATEQGLRQLAERGQDAIDERDRSDARETLETFFEGLRDDEVPVAYGREEVDDALAYDAVETLLLSTALEGAQLQEFGDRTLEQGGETVVVPADFPDGERFREAFDGLGALLRFPVD
ncbi:Vms1/Ankzf1 family peptidyl-tRNA hydrolase [Natrinema marinum]|uniref:Vms1/Ankzf1 family peptidyl-tRNA hydrolase n=1 Tax=Natrinema marinum TaxID=2961598 RepID=UPI0020C91F53|nr:Vms1/Ankzf1 family peptidyl-tRNA hydrolase [Natrinema marinum]